MVSNLADLYRLLQDRYAVIFPGQGTQRQGMGSELYKISAAARRIFDLANKIVGIDLIKFYKQDSQSLDDTSVCQPAVIAVNLACYYALIDLGYPAPSASAGHSLGTLAALCVADAITVEDTFKLVAFRAKTMSEAGSLQKGAMAAIIGLGKESIKKLCSIASGGEVLDVATENSPIDYVVSGTESAVARAINLAKEMGAKRAVKLKISIGAHSQLMADAQAKFSQYLKQISIRPPKFIVGGSATGKILEKASDVVEELQGHIAKPVGWATCIGNLAQNGIRSYLELGPSTVLGNLIRRNDPQANVYSLNDTQVANSLLFVRK
jgi:[acyl-carrier-protein] S-malonyltransferase